MKLDEFAFFNQQLGRMLQDGIPLEGALKRLCANMRRSKTRVELEALGRDLADGRPLDQALAHRRLPDLYVRLLKMGARSNSLPDLLLMLADHYQRVSFLWIRLKGLLVYPALVLLVALGISIHITITLHGLFNDPIFGSSMRDFMWGRSTPTPLFHYRMLGPPVLLTLLALAACLVLAVPALRRRVTWWLPAFRDAALARLASVISLSLRGGATFPEALDTARDLLGKSPAARDVAAWKAALAAGATRFADMAQPSRRFPKLFIWLVDSADEDLPGGFAHAAEIYHARAHYRAEMMLYGFLPASVLLLGGMLFGQVYLVTSVAIRFMERIGMG